MTSKDPPKNIVLDQNLYSYVWFQHKDPTAPVVINLRLPLTQLIKTAWKQNKGFALVIDPPNKTQGSLYVDLRDSKSRSRDRDIQNYAFLAFCIGLAIPIVYFTYKS